MNVLHNTFKMTKSEIPIIALTRQVIIMGCQGKDMISVTIKTEVLGMWLS